MGESAAALPHLERGQALYDPVRHGSYASLYAGHDPGVCCRYHLARVQWLLGYPNRALAALRDALTLAETLVHPQTTVMTLSFAAFLFYHLGDHEAARESAERAVALATARGLPAWVDTAVVLACVGIREGSDSGRLTEAYQRLIAPSVAPTAWRTVICLCLLAEAFGEVGDSGSGLEALSAIPEEHRGTFFAPELERVRGELLLSRRQRDEAGRCFRRAIAIARDRSERSLELRAATSLARLLRQDGRREEARGTLGEVYGWFTEGFDTTDLTAAKAMLDQLA